MNPPFEGTRKCFKYKLVLKGDNKGNWILSNFHFGPKQHVLSSNVMSFSLTALLAGRTQKARHYQLVLITRAVVALLIKCFIGIQSQLHPIRFSSSQALNVSHIHTSRLNSWLMCGIEIGFPPFASTKKGQIQFTAQCWQKHHPLSATLHYANEPKPGMLVLTLQDMLANT